MGVLGNKTRLLYGFYDMSGDTYEWEISQTVGELEKTVLTSTAMEYVPSIVEGSLTFSGYLKVPSATFVESRLNNVLNSGTENVALLLNYQTFPSPVIIFPNAFNNTVNFSASVNEMLTFNGGVRSRSPIQRGHLINYAQSVVLAGALPSVQVPSIVNTNNGNIFLFLHSITGTPATDIQIDVQSSANNSTFTTNATFTFSGQKSTFAGTYPAYVGPYIRANVVSLGDATGINFSVVVTKN